jgi:hypothetical protein
MKNVFVEATKNLKNVVESNQKINMFKLRLSVSTKAAISKEAAQTINKFEVKDIDVKSVYLQELFTSRLYSGNHWKDGSCKNDNFTSMSAIILDADQDIKIEEAKEIFKDCHYIIHTSTSHLADLERKGGKQDRFRIILPLNPEIYNQINSAELTSALYKILFEKYTWADDSCKDAARKFYPFLNKTYPDLFQMYVNEGKDYYNVDFEKVTEKLNESSESVVPINEKFIYLNSEFILPDKKNKIRVRDVHKHTPVYCVFCDDLESQNASAFIGINAKGKPYLYCSHCIKTYWLAPEDEYGDLFFLGNQLMQVFTSPTDIAISTVSQNLLNNLDQRTKVDLLQRISANRTIPEGSFEVARLSAADIETASHELDAKNWKLTIKIPAKEVIKKDNAYIEKWLNDLFKEHAEFIKNWLAIYCWTNYVQLPNLILTGDRGTGKNTFAELIMNIFPLLSDLWGAETDNFTEYFEKKLLLVDENDNDKKEQYNLLKKVSGAEYLSVNIKYGPKFKVLKNVNIIILSNEERPIFLKLKEKPKNDRENQFFMLRMQPRTEIINSNIKFELKDRIGHYIRTELRKRYLAWDASGIKRLCRYGLPTPITQDLLNGYEASKTSIESECEEIYEIIKNGRNVMDKFNVVIKTLGPYEYVLEKDLREIITLFGFRATDTNGFRKHMQDHKMLSSGGAIRTANKRLGYKVL